MADEEQDFDQPEDQSPPASPPPEQKESDAQEDWDSQMAALEASNPLGAKPPEPTESQVPDVGEPEIPDLGLEDKFPIEEPQKFQREGQETPATLPHDDFVQPQYPITEEVSGVPASLTEYLEQQEERKALNPPPMEKADGGLPDMTNEAFQMDAMNGEGEGRSFDGAFAKLMQANTSVSGALVDIALDHEQQLAQLRRRLETGRL